MSRPESFRKVEPTKSCADCKTKKNNYKERKCICTKHDFEIPIDTRTQEKYTCNDVDSWEVE